MGMEKVIENFIAYMREAKKASQNTEISYERDLKKLARYLRNQKIMDFSEVTKTDLQGYLKELQKENLALSTISRNIASIRALYHYMIRTGKMQEDPSETLKPPKLEKKMPEILSVEEVDRLLKQPDLNTPKGIRDNAMMELMYATGDLAYKNFDGNYTYCGRKDMQTKLRGFRIELEEVEKVVLGNVSLLNNNKLS